MQAPGVAWLLPEVPCCRRWWPAPLWDKHALVPKAPFLWGSPDQLCSIVNASATVALVGNGPLTPEQRQEINKAGSVLRINAMNNRQAFPADSKRAGLQHGKPSACAVHDVKLQCTLSELQRSGCTVSEGLDLCAGSQGTR